LSCGTYGQAVRFIPPLVTTEDEIDQAIDICGEVLATL
jgi:4-aminobutyrate aminotransferase-like enzyme